MENRFEIKFAVGQLVTPVKDSQGLVAGKTYAVERTIINRNINTTYHVVRSTDPDAEMIYVSNAHEILRSI